MSTQKAIFTRVGDRIEVVIRQPIMGTIRLKLLSPEACEQATRLLADPRSGWVRCNASSPPGDDLGR